MAEITTLMTANPACCRQDTALQQVAQLMIDHDCGQIPVVDADNRPLGVVTDRDIAIRAVAAGKDMAGCTAGDVMSTPCRTVESSTSIKDAVCLMEAEKIRRVPVVDADGRLSGIVSIADLALAGKHEATAEVVKQVSEPGKG